MKAHRGIERDGVGKFQRQTWTKVVKFDHRGIARRVVFSLSEYAVASPLLARLDTTNGRADSGLAEVCSPRANRSTMEENTPRRRQRGPRPTPDRTRPTADRPRRQRHRKAHNKKSLQFFRSQEAWSNSKERTSLYLGDNFTVVYSQWFKFHKLIWDPLNSGVIHTTFHTLKSLDKMVLSSNAIRLSTVPNAGGSSDISEVLSYELLHRCFGARLLKTEMEVEYFPCGGSITDYMCEMGGVKMGVSVTRAMKYYGSYTEEDAQKLLDKKLTGIVRSSRNSLENWNKQILHVWAKSKTIANHVTKAFDLLGEETKSNTVVLVTVASNCDSIFTNK